MIPVGTTECAREIDATSLLSSETLKERAGYAVYAAGRRMLGGTYGRRVVVVAGKGSNGDDGRIAAELFRRHGAVVEVVQPSSAIRTTNCHLVVDAAYGTGFRGSYQGPNTHGAPVLAVDIPSGVDGNTGVASDGAVVADKTATFNLLKPGHLLADGPQVCGPVEVVDIGLDVGRATMALVEKHDVLDRLPAVRRDGHKHQTSCLVVAGSAGMLGAARLAARGAQHCGSGFVHLAVPGVSASELPVAETVGHVLPERQWHDDVLKYSQQTKALVIGPGLARTESTIRSVREVVARAELPVVIDASGLYALSDDVGLALLGERRWPTVLTPHDKEFERLTKQPVRARRWESVVECAVATNSVVLLKGSTTVIADPKGAVLFTNSGDARLATAGTGDVLAGVAGALLAQQVDPLWAAASAAFVHGAAAVEYGSRRGMVAGDLPAFITRWLTEHGNG